ncbi:MAG: hypothetical protein QOE35_4170 [Actinomycetota bacterium]|jgi:hypothetical protein
MALRTWHPYAPDQAFGCRAAQDEDLVDATLARLDRQARPAPRAGSKAVPSPVEVARGWEPSDQQMVWLASAADAEPVTMATALDAAARLHAD